MKRLVSFMMALVLVLSLGVTAFAAEGTGSITITNATVDQEYAPYKIFDASISGGSDGGFTYSITKDNQFFDDIFGTEGAADFNTNAYFEYHADGSVVKRAGVADADVLEYLKLLVYNKEADGTDAHGNTVYKYTPKTGLIPAADPATDTDKDKVVKFENLDYGYYVITSSLGTTVTVNSTDPDVVVIDKNQKPGDSFEKLVFDEDKNEWVTSSSASVGDLVEFMIDFHATNYNGEKQVKYYRIHDTKGDALWVEFNSITVEVDGDPLRGAYYGVNDAVNTNNWDYFGDWSGVDQKIENAEWLLVHRGYDDFDIVIPWMSDFNIKTIAADPNFEMTFGDDAESMYASSSDVVIKYKASVEPGADIDGTKKNLYNRADLSWMDDTLVDPPGESETNLTVHALGITKTDGVTKELLAGATFELFKNEACTDPLYVIPTDVKGVYMVDDKNTVVSGDHRESVRKLYEKNLDGYLRKDAEDNVKEQDNYVVTQANGKLVVLGLEAGTYYLKEVEAPSGYNKLATTISIAVPDASKTEEFTFNMDADGNVVASGGTKAETYKSIVNMPVTNNKGTELPSTGGTGTMMLITIGSMIAMAFAVLLITHKKMSTYHD